MHEYMRRLLLAEKRGLLPAGGVTVASVAHDATCGIFSQKECDCDPEITLITKDGVTRVTQQGYVRFSKIPNQHGG